MMFERRNQNKLRKTRREDESKDGCRYPGGEGSFASRKNYFFELYDLGMDLAMRSFVIDHASLRLKCLKPIQLYG